VKSKYKETSRGGLGGQRHRMLVAGGHDAADIGTLGIENAPVRLVRAADDVLVPVDHGPGHHPASRGEQEDHELGDFIDLAEPAHGD